MKLTKSQLKKMILQEIKISIGAFLEEGELGNAGVDDPQGGRVEGEPANFGSGGDIAQISEDDEEESGTPLEQARNARQAREKKAQRIRNQRQADHYGRENTYGDEAPADFRARKAQGTRNKRMGIEDKYGDEAPSAFRAKEASKIRKQRLADRRASGKLSEDDDPESYDAPPAGVRATSIRGRRGAPGLSEEEVKEWIKKINQMQDGPRKEDEIGLLKKELGRQ